MPSVTITVIFMVEYFLLIMVTSTSGTHIDMTSAMALTVFHLRSNVTDTLLYITDCVQLKPTNVE